MANDIFARLEKFTDEQLNTLVTSIQNGISNDIATIMLASITLYVIVYGYMILAGKIQTPLQDLLWNLARFSIIIAFIQNADNLLTSAGEAVKALSTMGNDGKSGMSILDEQIEAISRFSDRVGNDANSGLAGDIAAGLISAIIWLGFGLMAIPLFLTFALSKITLYVLLALAPVFLFCLMWGWLKDSFANWVSALLANAMVLMIMSIISKTVAGFLSSQTAMTGNPWLVAFSFLGMGLFCGVLVQYLAGVVNSIMRVSAEKAGAGVMGVLQSARGGIDKASSLLAPTQGSIAKSQLRANQAQERATNALESLAKKLDK